VSDTVRTAPPDLAGLDWASLAEQTYGIYQAVLAAGDRQLAPRPATSPLVGMASRELSEDQPPFERDEG
jgi:hypothetical protein